ncbi:MAG TPA: hypothetical protein VF815_10775 [Myxococcaceae bacterium]|jgi:hypothetical protein
MDEELQQFEAVLSELRELMLDLGDLSSRVVLIGGQVLALESRQRGGSGVIAAETSTGEVVQRGFTFEPDLLFNLDGHEFMAHRLTDVLTARGYQRARQTSWSKPLGKTFILIDLFAPEGVDLSDLPTPMTPLREAELVLQRSKAVDVPIGNARLRIAIPDPVGFLAMKTRAKLEIRPEKTKDSFDIFTYVQLVKPKVILEALQEAGAVGRELQRNLLRLFYSRSSPGVMDVVASANTLDPDQQELLAQSVVDLFAEF